MISARVSGTVPLNLGVLSVDSTFTAQAARMLVVAYGHALGCTLEDSQRIADELIVVNAPMPQERDITAALIALRDPEDEIVRYIPPGPAPHAPKPPLKDAAK